MKRNMRHVVDCWPDSFGIAKWTRLKGWHVPADMREYWKLSDALEVLEETRRGENRFHGAESKRTKYKLIELVHVDVD